jgi:hypothetical protein
MLLVAEVVETRGEVRGVRRDLELEGFAVLGCLVAGLEME